jgi:hypothetical protein
MTTNGNDTQGQPHYLSYLLRLWQVTLAGEVAWRASLECPHTGDRLGFADLDSLWSFLQSQMQSEAGSGRAPEEGDSNP